MADFRYGHLAIGDSVSAAMAQISTMIQETYLPGIQTQIFYDNPIWDRFWKAKKPMPATSYNRRVMKSQYFGGQFWDDKDTATLDQQYTRDTVRYDGRKFRLPLYVSDADAKVAAQGGDPAKSQLLEVLLEDARATIDDMMGSALYLSPGTALLNPAASINALFAKAPSGLLEMVPYYDQSSDTTSRTYAGVPVIASGASAKNTWWQPQCIFNATAPPPTLDAVYKLISLAKRRGRARPTLAVTTGPVWDALATIIGAYGWTTFQDKQNAGMDMFSIRNIDVIADPHCPGGSADQPT